MKEFNINVHVQIGITDALFGLLSALAKHVAPVAAPAPVPEPAHQDPPAVVEAAPQVTAPVIPEPAPAETPADEEKELTEVDVRAAMDRTRRRIEGENYKEDTDSEGYKRWHRTLNHWFRSTAAIRGADKPSALPDHASRKGFIADCDAVHVENDELVITPPF